MTDEEAAWLAGLLEGEGTFASMTNQFGYVTSRIVLAMTDEDVVVRAASLMQSSAPWVRRSPSVIARGGKPMYETRLNGLRAVALMNRILPYMGERRSAKIRDVIERNGTNANYGSR